MIYGRAHSCGRFLKSGWTVGGGEGRGVVRTLTVRAHVRTRAFSGRTNGRSPHSPRTPANNGDEIKSLGAAGREVGWGGGVKKILLTIC